MSAERHEARHTIRFPNSRRYVSVARRAVIDFAKAAGIPERTCEDLRSAVGEALANAVEHGYKERTYFCIRCWLEGDNFVVEVEDDGRGFDPDASGPRETSALRGYGLTLMRTLVDSVAFARNGRTVRLEKKIDRTRVFVISEGKSQTA